MQIVFYSRTYDIPSNPYASYVLLFRDVDHLLNILLNGAFQLEKQSSESDYRNFYLADWSIGYPLHLPTKNISQIKSHHGISR